MIDGGFRLKSSIIHAVRLCTEHKIAFNDENRARRHAGGIFKRSTRGLVRASFRDKTRRGKRSGGFFIALFFFFSRAFRSDTSRNYVRAFYTETFNLRDETSFMNLVLNVDIGHSRECNEYCH